MCETGTETLGLRTTRDTEEVVLGMCAAIAMFTDSLVRSGFLERGDVLNLLRETELALPNRHRKLAVKAVRHFLHGFGKIPTAD